MSTQKFTAWLAAGLLATATAMAQAQAKAFSARATYMVIDLSGGPGAKKYPVRYASQLPDMLETDLNCRTTEIWLRLVPAGKFMMGSPADEIGRRRHHMSGDETLRQVTLTRPFYIGIFPVTQKQYELVTGKDPSERKGDTRPVENVSLDMLRGTSLGSQWPASNDVDADSFFGIVRAKTSLTADLPTEAQWEYACRAGTTTALNSGKNLTDRYQCPHMDEVGRYGKNRDDGKGGGHTHHTKVGMYKPNAWGLYDMHGNVWDWCLDYVARDIKFEAAPVTDPKGLSSGFRILRGGCFGDDAHASRAAMRLCGFASKDTNGVVGFRIIVLPDAGKAADAIPAEVSTEEDERLAETCAEFKAVWDGYKGAMEKTAAEHQGKLDALQQQYMKALETLKGTVQKQGDLEKTMAITAEIGRFGDEKDVPPEPGADTIAEVKRLQASYAKAVVPLERERATRLAPLAQRYAQALERLQADLVKAGKVEDAVAVKEARERARQR